MGKVEQAREYSISCHRATNHTYGDNEPYAVHLHMVASFVKQFYHLLPQDLRETALCVAYTHDVIEDCRQTYNDVKEALGFETAEATYALTNEKGKNRAERANSIYYEGIRANQVAHFVKICDRLANAQYSKDKKSSMLKAYRHENDKFKQELYTPEYDEMFKELELILS